MKIIIGGSDDLHWVMNTSDYNLQLSEPNLSVQLYVRVMCGETLTLNFFLLSIFSVLESHDFNYDYNTMSCMYMYVIW